MPACSGPQATMLAGSFGVVRILQYNNSMCWLNVLFFLALPTAARFCRFFCFGLFAPLLCFGAVASSFPSLASSIKIVTASMMTMRGEK